MRSGGIQFLSADPGASTKACGSDDICYTRISCYFQNGTLLFSQTSGGLSVRPANDSFASQISIPDTLTQGVSGYGPRPPHWKAAADRNSSSASCSFFKISLIICELEIQILIFLVLIQIYVYTSRASNLKTTRVPNPNRRDCSGAPGAFSKSCQTIAEEPARLVPEECQRPPMEEQTLSLSSLDRGDDAAADPGEDRSSLLPSLDEAISGYRLHSRVISRGSPALLGRPGVLLQGPACSPHISNRG